MGTVMQRDVQGKNHLIFQPSGRRSNFPTGSTLHEAARALGVSLESICQGKGNCSKCKITVSRGSENLSPLTEAEMKIFSPKEIGDGFRLACQAKIVGPVEIALPAVSQRGEQVIRKSLSGREYGIDPALVRYWVRLQPPALGDQEADLSRILRGLEEQCRLPSLGISHRVLKTLPESLRNAGWQPEVTVWDAKEIVRIDPQGSRPGLYGLAVDVGTTTVAGYLVDLSNGHILGTHALMNPQVAFGEDVMTRITYGTTHLGGEEHLHALIIAAVDEIARGAASQAGISTSDLGEVVVVGNTCMHHLFLGLSPGNIGKSPFTPALKSHYNVKADELGFMAIPPEINVHTLPLVSGFVGADTIGVLLATEPWTRPENQLIMDIGTNGEIVLATNGRLLACSVATGPAFEGAHIRCGMRAASGAIDSVTLNAEYEIAWTTIGSEKPRGICGSGIISAVAHLFARGIIQRTGKMVSSFTPSRLREGFQGLEYVLVRAPETAIEEDIVITRKDIENIQMAKAALYAGSKILMIRAGVEKIDRILLAGAFGSFIDPWSAYRIGMLPECDLHSVSMVGNAAGDGAVAALVNRNARARAEALASEIEYVELTLDPLFEHEFAMALAFPHMRDTFSR
jgi:uncharacterized 2Fe-2S/4Fe-4S cluster protein (DUF4445 family)